MTATEFGEQLLHLLPTVSQLYHRLILVVAPGGGGKSAALQSLANGSGAPLVNLNLELSRGLLDLTARQRKLQVSRRLSGLVAQARAQANADSPVLLDNTEILFEVSLSIDPLRLLEEVSRNWTLVVAWRGRIDGDHLVYAYPGHPEYRRYPVGDLLIVTANDRTASQ